MITVVDKVREERRALASRARRDRTRSAEHKARRRRAGRRKAVILEDREAVVVTVGATERAGGGVDAGSALAVSTWRRGTPVRKRTGEEVVGGVEQVVSWIVLEEIRDRSIQLVVLKKTVIVFVFP